MLLDGQLSADVVHLTLMSLCHHGGRLGVDAGGIAAAHAVTLTAVPVLYRCPTHVRYDVPWKSPRICVDANQVSFLPSAEGEPEDVISVPVDQSDAPKLVAALSSLRRADPETPLFIQAREWDTQAWHLARVLDLAAAAGYRYAVLETPEECDGRKSIAEPTKKSDDPRGHVTVLGANGLLAPDLAKHFASRLDDLAQCYRQRLRWDPDYAADFDVSVNPGQPSGTQVRLERPVPQRLHQCFESALGNYSFPQELRDRYPSFTVRLAKTADK
jgi:hypothetical protein